MDTNTQAVEAIKALTHELPLNDFGLPIGIYRCDLLPFHDYAPNIASDPRPVASGNGEESSSTELAVPCDSQLTEGSEPSKPNGANGEHRIAGFLAKSLNQAFVPLQYDEGFPAFNDGTAFWSRLECEPHDIYLAFDQYLKMPLGRTPDPEDDEDFGLAASGTRSLASLVEKLHPNLPNNQLLARIEQYRANYYLYYWGMRAHAYDLFRVAQHQKQQELRALETQDEHYVDARKIRHRLMQYINDDTEFWDMMTPKVAIDLLKSTTQLERISAGIPGAGPPIAGSEGESRKGQPFEIAFRTVAQSNRPQVRATIDEDGEVLSRALEDPEALEVLQELIIRSGG